MADEQNSNKFRPLRSLTRLLIGGILLGSEALDNQLKDWDSDGEKADTAVQNHDADESLPETLPAPLVGLPRKGSSSDGRFALIGLIFEGEEKLDDALDAARRAGIRAYQVLDPLGRPIRRIVASGPIQNGKDQLTKRGQSAVDRWISRGREEATYSRELSQKAATSTVDQSIHYMAENEAITELIQTQGVSLAEQILELIRSISVSADYYVEGLVRYIFRQRPRYLLPPPSQEVQEQATWMLQDIRQEDM